MKSVRAGRPINGIGAVTQRTASRSTSWVTTNGVKIECSRSTLLLFKHIRAPAIHLRSMPHAPLVRAVDWEMRIGLQDFGINPMTLPPGSWSSQRHLHSDEDEFVCVLEGELTLVEDNVKTVVRAGERAAFPKGTGNGHHLINESSAMAVYLEVGSRNQNDLTTCSDIDMMSSNADGRFVRKDGTPY